MKKGFTLIELLAVIVILAIILAIAIPSISSLISNSTEGAFESNAKLLMNAIKIKTLEDSSLDPTTITESNIKTLLGLDDSNYKKISVSIKNGAPYIVVVGKNKWDNLIAMGDSNNVLVQDGMILLFDASNTDSYPENGTTIYDLSGKTVNGTINGSVTWISDGEDSYFNFPSNANTDYISTTISQNYKDIFVVFQPNRALTYDNNLSMLVGNGADQSIRFGTVGWGIPNPGNSNDWANVVTNYYINGIKTNMLPASGWVTLTGYRTNYGSFPSNFTLRVSGGIGNRNFSGKIAILMMFDKELSLDERNSIFNYVRGRFGL